MVSTSVTFLCFVVNDVNGNNHMYLWSYVVVEILILIVYPVSYPTILSYISFPVKNSFYRFNDD